MDRNYESNSLLIMTLRAVRASMNKRGYEARPEFMQELRQLWKDMEERNRMDLIEVKMPANDAQELLDELNELTSLAEGYAVTQKFADLLQDLIKSE